MWRRFNFLSATVSFLAAGIFLLGFFLLAGCGGFEQPADLVIINGHEPESLDPAQITGQADGRVALALFEGLTRYDPVHGAAEAGLAERWEISSDGRVYLFYLRENARWSTGEPITAHDFVYSWRRALDPATGCDYSGLLFYVKNAEEFATGKIRDPSRIGVEALGDRTLRVELVSPTSFFLDICAFQTLAAVPRQAIEPHGDRWLKKRPVPASGAYQLEYWQLNHKIRLRKNPFYWDAGNTQSEVIDLLPCTIATTALNLYETGQADIVWDKDLVPNELMDVLLPRPDFHSFDYLATYFLRFNVTRKPLDDVRVRQALAMALDKDRLVSKIMKAGEKSAEHYVPPGLPNYQSPAGLGYDPDRARRLLAEAGFPGGKGFPRMEYLYNTTGKANEQIAVELQAAWRKELGIEIELRKLEWKVYLRTQARLEYDICRSSWIGDYNDPNTFLDMFMSNNGNNRTGWASPRYDELLREANLEMEPGARAEKLRAAERLLIAEEAPIVPIYFYSGVEYYDPAKVKGIYPNLRSEHPLRTIRKVR